MNKNMYKTINKNQTMKQIATRILEINGLPMHYKDIWNIMLNEVGYCSRGLSPWATLNSLIGRDDSFTKYRGIVRLTRWIHPVNGESKIPEKFRASKNKRKCLSGFKKILIIKIHPQISRVEMSESYGVGIIEHDTTPKTYRVEIDRTR